MKLDLTREEARELKSALDLRLIALQDELVHTDDRAYRVSLKDSWDTLDRLARRLERLLEPELLTG